MTATKHGLPGDVTARDLRDPATSETMVDSGVRQSAPTVGRAERGDGGPRRGDSIGRFVVLGVLGEGGMGVVYSGYDPHLDRKVAIKLLRPEAMGIGDAHARLLREAQAMAKIDHPNVVHVHEVGTLDEQIYVAMEFCDGGTLRTWLGSATRSPAAILERFAQAGRGLAAAHAAGLVHRDFKPDNVLLTKDLAARVTDFGLVTLASELSDTERVPRAPTDRLLAPSSSHLSQDLTRTGSIMGTPNYMAPEQFQGRGATARTDQFAFCVALYEALYGARPFAGSTFNELCSNVLGGKFAPIAKPPRVPAALRRALLRGLSVEPEARFPSMEALLAALAPAARRRWPLALGAAALAALGGGVAVWLATNHDAAPRCADAAAARAAAAWSKAAAGELQARFAKSGRSYATSAAQLAQTSLDRYAARWTSLAGDVCAAEHAATGALPELVVRRRACLDARLDTLRGVVGLLTTTERASFVDHAREIVEGLPDLGDCADEAALLAAPGAPPPAQAAAVADLDKQLDLEEARVRAAEYREALPAAEQLVERADALGWPRLQARAHYVLGRARVAMILPTARAELVRAGELATANHLDREATRAWSMALLAAGLERSPDAFAVLEQVARGAAAGTHDRVLAAGVELNRARALLRLHRWQDGLAACREVRTLVEPLDDHALHSDARKCMIEALVPVGGKDELAPLLADAIAESTRELGADHPTVADFVAERVMFEIRAGKLDDAQRDAERVLAIRQRAFPAKHYKLIEAGNELAHVYAARGDDKRGQELYAQTLADSDEHDPMQILTITNILSQIGMFEASHGDTETALTHLSRAVELTREHANGDKPIELGVWLLEYGQVESQVDIDKALGILREGRDILVANHDKRAGGATIAMEVAAFHAERYDDAREFGEQAIAHLDDKSEIQEVAVAKSVLAQSLPHLHGDRKRYLQLAREAKQAYEQMGPSAAGYVKSLAKFIATH